MIKTVIMGTGRMGSLIRTTAEGIVDAAGQPVFDIVTQIGFDLSELENAPAADVIIDFSNVATFDAVVESNPPVRVSFEVLHLCQSWAREHVGSRLKSLEFLFVSGIF